MVLQLIWGSSNGGRKMDLVSWEFVCQPRSCGGLGFRRLRDHLSSIETWL